MVPIARLEWPRHTGPHDEQWHVSRADNLDAVQRRRHRRESEKSLPGVLVATETTTTLDSAASPPIRILGAVPAEASSRGLALSPCVVTAIHYTAPTTTALRAVTAIKERFLGIAGLSKRQGRQSGHDTNRSFPHDLIPLCGPTLPVFARRSGLLVKPNGAKRSGPPLSINDAQRTRALAIR